MADSFLLLVEDSASDEVLTRRALEKEQITRQLTVVRDGAAALDFLFARGDYAERDAGDLPRAVLLDLNLPQLGGLEVLQRVRTERRTRDLPVVIMTSSSQDSDLVKAYALGANSYIVKPVDFVQFSEIVRHVGRYWLMLNRTRPHDDD